MPVGSDMNSCSRVLAGPVNLLGRDGISSTTDSAGPQAPLTPRGPQRWNLLDVYATPDTLVGWDFPEGRLSRACLTRMPYEATRGYTGVILCL